MAAFNIYHDTRRPKKDGTCPLKIMIYHKKSFLIPLKLSVDPGNFIDGEIVFPNDARRASNMNKYIKTKLSAVENTILKLDITGVLATMDDKDLKTALCGNIDNDERDTPPSFVEALNMFIGTKQKKGTRQVYRSTLRMLERYCDSAFINIDNLQFKDMTSNWLHNFDLWMSSFCMVNYKALNMRNIRTVFNYAISEKFIELNDYPFRNFKIKHEKTRKRSLTVDELRTLRDYDVEPHMQKYRDIFMLSFYLIGINPVDLLHAKELYKGNLEYKRAKTGRLYTIKVEPEAMDIIDKYRGKKFLINVMDRYSDYTNFTKKANNNLKKIGPYYFDKKSDGPGPGKKVYEGLFPDISIYWARHTWATLASKIGIDKDTIAAALGHGSEDTTDIYIDFDQEKIDVANRKVIDFVNGKN